MALAIPERYKPGFEELANLPVVDAEALISAFERVRPSYSSSQLISQLSELVNLGSDALGVIVDVLLSLYALKGIRKDASPEDLVADLMPAIQAETPVGDGYDWERFARWLTALLNFENTIGVTAKAAEVAHEQQYSLCNSETRILTDLRPVFQPDADAAPAGAIIIHNLKLSYHLPDGELGAMFIALNGRDIAMLKELLIRAEKKATSLERCLDSCSIQILDPRG